MTPSPQTPRPQLPTLAGAPAGSTDELVRITVEACEQAHEACLHAVRQALSRRREAPPLDAWLTGASLCRTLAEVLALEPSPDLPRTSRPPLSPWAVGMARLCASLCQELAGGAERQAGLDEEEMETAQRLRQACRHCEQTCIRLLAEGSPLGGQPMEARRCSEGQAASPATHPGWPEEASNLPLRSDSPLAAA